MHVKRPPDPTGSVTLADDIAAKKQWWRSVEEIDAKIAKYGPWASAMPLCQGCGIRKNREDYPTCGYGVDGHKKYRAVCTECYNKKRRS